ncbi:pilus assembly PilX family protein [Pseudomonas sp. Marseille-QA0892]
MFIALVMLLVITLLAVSSAREVTLEYRMTGDFLEQQRLLNAAESGLREGEYALSAPAKPLNATTSCGTNVCLLDQKPTYAQNFGKSVKYGTATNTELPEQSSVRWYAVPTPSGEEIGEAENPEYGNMMQGIGTFRYEINSEARNTQTGEVTRLRSTSAKVFN